MTELEKSTMTDVLIWTDCRNLPKKDDGKSLWVRAIALVGKNDGSKSYCVIERRYNGEMQVVKDFGHAAAIKVYLSVHPYEFVKEKYIKKWNATDTKEMKLRYINVNLNTGFDVNSLTDEQLEAQLCNVAIYRQYIDTVKQ